MDRPNDVHRTQPDTKVFVSTPTGSNWMEGERPGASAEGVRVNVKAEDQGIKTENMSFGGSDVGAGANATTPPPLRNQTSQNNLTPGGPLAIRYSNPGQQGPQLHPHGPQGPSQIGQVAGNSLHPGSGHIVVNAAPPIPGHGMVQEFRLVNAYCAKIVASGRDRRLAMLYYNSPDLWIQFRRAQRVVRIIQRTVDGNISILQTVYDRSQYHTIHDVQFAPFPDMFISVLVNNTETYTMIYQNHHEKQKAYNLWLEQRESV